MNGLPRPNDPKGNTKSPCQTLRTISAKNDVCNQGVQKLMNFNKKNICFMVNVFLKNTNNIRSLFSLINIVGIASAIEANTFVHMSILCVSRRSCE